MVKRGWLIVILAFVVMPILPSVLPTGTGATLTAQDVDAETEALFMAAIDLYKRGHDAEALEKLKQVLAKDPSNAEAFALRDKVAFSLWIDLMVKKGEHRAVINEFLRLASVGERAKRKDEEAVKKLLEQIRTGDYAAKREATMKIERDHGDFAAPAIISLLAESSNDEYRNDLLRLLSQLGPEVTLPLVQCLKSDDVAVKTQVVIALGLIKDDRASAPLKSIMERSTEESLIKAAERARRSLGLTEAMMAKSAKELFVDLASKYYRRAPGVMKEFSANRVVWQWVNGKLTYYEVPLYLYHLYVAEEFAYDALSNDPNDKAAQVWLARIHLAQKQELEAAASAGSDEAKSLAEKMAKADFLAVSAGVENLEDAVRMSLKDKDLAVAEAGIFTIGKLLTAATFQGGVLAEAVASEHKIARYAAAIAIGNLTPNAKEFANADKVSEQLSRCISESTLRTILVIDDNMETRNQLLRELRSLGYAATGAHNGAVGIVLAKRGPSPDLVILKTTLGNSDTSISTGEVLRELKSDVRTKDLPVIGLANEARVQADKDLYGDKLVEVIKIPLIKDSYAGTIKDAFGERDENQAKALRYAEMAAKALAKLAMADTLEPRKAVPDLIATLNEKPDNVKLPAIQALGAIGDASASTSLKDVFANEGQSPEVRAGAAVAIGHISRNNGSIELDVYQALLEGLGSSDLTVSRGAATGLGIAPLTPAQRSEVDIKHRITLNSIFQQ